MDRQNSITLEGITNFLQAGALLRHGSQWILIEGPFTAQPTPNSVEISVFCPDFYDLTAPARWFGKARYTLSTEELRRICEVYLAQEPRTAEPLMTAHWEEPRLEDFAEALSVIQSRIEKNEIQKAVPAVFARTNQTVTAQDRAQMLLKLSQAPATLFAYGFWKDGEGVLGATPETLFDFSKGVLKTMALAGTCPKSESTERESLLSDEKEMLEHRLVVEDLKERLSAWGTVQASAPYILELPTLYHLKTDISVVCQNQPNFVELVKALHPTPALGVAPRSAGYVWMKALPGQQGRRWFGGPFAFIGAEEALCLVGIRNLQWSQDSAMIGSGCGVVAASELDREWRELFQKRLSVKKILGLEV